MFSLSYYWQGGRGHYAVYVTVPWYPKFYVIRWLNHWVHYRILLVGFLTIIVKTLQPVILYLPFYHHEDVFISRGRKVVLKFRKGVSFKTLKKE